MTDYYKFPSSFCNFNSLIELDNSYMTDYYKFPDMKQFVKGLTIKQAKAHIPKKNNFFIRIKQQKR